MASPVETAMAMEALRVPSDDEMAFEQYLNGATGSVYAYLGWEDADYDAASENAQEQVKTAILILAGHYYRSPDVDEHGAFQQGQLPWLVTAPLYQLRDPALA